MGRFVAEIEAFRERTMQRADILVRKIALDTFKKVQSKTPVDSGQLRRSWTVSVGEAPSVFNGSNEVINNAKFGNTLYIATDKPYALTLEYGLYPKPGGRKTNDGFSIQAPKGMVRITVQEMEALLKKSRW